MFIFRFQSQLLTPRTIQAHCTFLDTSSLSHLHTRGTAVAHCPLSNAYFSAQPFRLREAFDCGVKVGLGTDVAGGYSIDIMSAMRQAVVVSRMREGSRLMGNTPESSQAGDVMEGTGPEQNLAIDWKEALYIATRGGALALNAPHYRGMFEVGASFDAQCSTFASIFSDIHNWTKVPPSKSIWPRIRRCRCIGFLRFGELQHQVPFRRDGREVVVSRQLEKSNWNVGTG